MHTFKIVFVSVLFFIHQSANCQSLERGDDVTLKSSEGLALFDIKIDAELTRIRLDRIDSIFSFPKIEDLPAGSYSRLLKLPAGQYKFSKFQMSRIYWEFDDVRNSNFTIEPGKINYVGEINSSSTGWLSRSLSIENAASRARQNLDRDFPGLLAKFPWRFTGEFADPFFDNASPKPSLAIFKPEAVVEPTIADRDAAEIFFRTFPNYTFEMSPDGKFALESVSEGQNIALNLIEIDTGKIRTVYTGIPLQRAQWVDNKYLAISVGNSENRSFLFRIDSIETIIQETFPSGQFWGIVPKTSEVIFYATGDSKGKIVSFLPSAKMDDKKIRKIRALRVGMKAADWWIDGSGQLRLAQLNSDSEKSGTRWVYFAPETDEKIEFKLPTPKNYRFSISGFDESGKILVLSNKKTEFNELFEFNPRSGELGDSIARIEGADIEEVIWSVNNQIGRYVFYSNGHRLERSFTNVGEEATLSALRKALPNRNIVLGSSQLSNRKSGRRLVYTDGPEDPGSAYVFDQSSKEARLLSLRAPHLEGRKLAATERFLSTAPDGFEIESFITHGNSNATDDKRPLLVLPHGGPFGVFDYQRYDSEVQYFANIGFSVLQVNFRGSGGVGKLKIKLAERAWGTGMISDVNAAVDNAIKKYPLDPDSIVVVGSSYGGFSALRLLQSTPRRYKAAVGICGVYDLPLLFHSGRNSRSELGIKWMKKYIGDPTSNLDELVSQSPVYLKSKFQVPVLLVHDRGDGVAPFEHALRMQSALIALNSEVTLLPTNDNAHGLTFAGTAIATYPKIAKFLREAIRKRN